MAYLVHGLAVNAQSDTQPVVTAEFGRTRLGGAREGVRKGLVQNRALLLLGGDGNRKVGVLQVLVGKRSPSSLGMLAGLGKVLGDVGGVVVLHVSKAKD